jgi:hypothetical protein
MNGWYKHVMYKPSKYGWFNIALQTDILSGFVSSSVTQPSHCYPLGLQWQPRPVSAHLPNFCLGPWHAMALGHKIFWISCKAPYTQRGSCRTKYIYIYLFIYLTEQDWKLPACNLFTSIMSTWSWAGSIVNSRIITKWHPATSVCWFSLPPMKYSSSI